jgi:hypothetical protein
MCLYTWATFLSSPPIQMADQGGTYRAPIQVELEESIAFYTAPDRSGVPPDRRSGASTSASIWLLTDSLRYSRGSVCHPYVPMGTTSDSHCLTSCCQPLEPV